MLAWKIWQQYLHLRVDVTLGLELQSRVSCVDIVLHQKFPRSFSFVDLEDYVIVSWTWLHLSPNTSWVLELVIRQLVYLSCCSYNLRFFFRKSFLFLVSDAESNRSDNNVKQAVMEHLKAARQFVFRKTIARFRFWKSKSYRRLLFPSPKQIQGWLVSVGEKSRRVVGCVTMWDWKMLATEQNAKF